MFDARKRMDPYYAGLTSAGDSFQFQMKLDRPLAEMNWADPFRPDDTVPEHVKKATIDCINSMAAHYTFPIGDRELRCEVAKRVKRVNGLDVDPDKNITICSGSDTAFVFTMRPFLVPGAGDEVMIPTPTYANDYDIAPLCGAKTVLVPTYAEDGYQLRVEEFEKRLTPHTKIVLITNPNNPTSTVYSRGALEKLADFVKKNDLLLVVDQCFEDTVFDGVEMVNIAAMPGMAERTVLISSLSKGMGLCGYRVGYIVASDDITDVYHTYAVELLGAPNTAAQAGILAALKDPAFMEDYRQEYMARAKVLADILDQIPHIQFQRPQSCFYFWIDVSYYGTAAEVMRYLAENAAVLVSPGGAFGSDQCIRLIYAAMRDRQDCIDAVCRIRDALLAHPNNH